MPGRRLLIYSTSPRKALVGEASVRFTEKLPLDDLFARYGVLAQVTRDEFEAYYANDAEGVALGLEFVLRYEAPVELNELRDKDHGFRPPQSYMRASAVIEALALAQRSRQRSGTFSGHDIAVLYP